MRALPNEFADAVELRCTSGQTPPKIGWGLSLASTPILVVYWMLLAPVVLGMAVVKLLKAH